MVSIIMFLIAIIFAILFWVWVVRAIIAKISKVQFGKKNTIALILFGVFGWVFFFIGISVFLIGFAGGGYKKVAENSASIAAVTIDSARKGWNKGLLKKLDSLTFELDSIKEVDDELNLSSSNFTTYEATLIIENKVSDATITYEELRDANIVYAVDDNDVFVPAFIVNHYAFDEVPWVLRFFLPNYRREAQNQVLPIGRSYLNIRVDVVEGHSLKSIGIGEHLTAID